MPKPFTKEEIGAIIQALDNPWQFQPIPFCREISGTERLERAGKEQLIKNMRFWPHHSEIEFLTTRNQKKVLQILRNFYQSLSLWLEFYEMGRHELLSELVLVPQMMEIKPFADLSVATLRFAKQVYYAIPKLEMNSNRKKSCPLE